MTAKDSKLGAEEFHNAVLDAYNSSAAHYAKSWPQPHAWMDQERKRFLALTGPGDRLLDAGCGPGQDANYWSSAGYDVTGIDASSSMINLARETYPDIAFEIADIRTYRNDLPFDCVWASYVFLHIPPSHVKRAIHNLRLNLRDSGKLFIATSISETESKQKCGPIAGLDEPGTEPLNVPTFEWSTKEWASLMTGFDLIWSREIDFMSGKSVVYNAIYEKA